MRTAAGLMAGVVAVGGCASAPERGEPPIGLDAVPLVYGRGRAVVTSFSVGPDRWEELSAFFEPPSETSAQERERIRSAVALLERIAGEQTPTRNDKAKNSTGVAQDRGQQDCVDESTNTTAYLRLLRERGLLRWHSLERPRWRAPWLFDSHRTAVIRDLVDGRLYAVDSWVLDNGEPPVVQELGAWLRKETPATGPGGG